MSYEKETQSEYWGFHEGWEIAELVGELSVLPVEILGDLVSETFEGFD